MERKEREKELSKVKYSNPLCDKHCLIRVFKHDDGYAVKIATDCDKCKVYAEKLPDHFGMMDLMSRDAVSKNAQPLCPTCFLDTTVLNALWLASGMISKHLAYSVPPITEEFVDPDAGAHKAEGDNA